jgi:uncharacterized membrane protein HdeD (DUF308 family)
VSARVSTLAAPAAALGGLLLIIFAVLVSFKPIGCIGTTCVVRDMRIYDEYAPLLLASLVFIFFGLAATIAHARALGRFGRLGWWGTILSGVGAVVLAVAILIQELLFDGDFLYMPSMVIPAILLITIGFLLLGLVLLRVLPKWVGTVLIIGGLLLPFSNDQDTRVLLFMAIIYYTHKAVNSCTSA